MSRSSVTAVLGDALRAALPVMAGYVGIGIPCGIMEQQIGMSALQAFLISAIFYSGAGQFMIANMVYGGVPLLTIIASVSFVNTRQVLYSASLSKFTEGVSKRLLFFFSAGVTDESYGVNIARFQEGGWSVSRALFVNLFSMSSWAISNAVGVGLGSLVTIPVELGMFAMTSIFICLLCVQTFNSVVVLVVVVTMAGVLFSKLVGLGAVSVLLGVLIGVAAGIVRSRVKDGEAG